MLPSKLTEKQDVEKEEETQETGPRTPSSTRENSQQEETIKGEGVDKKPEFEGLCSLPSALTDTEHISIYRCRPHNPC